jgi:hypothetical protein
MIDTKIHMVIGAQVLDVIYDYLDCGNLHLGFARVKCEDCNKVTRSIYCLFHVKGGHSVLNVIREE